MQWSEAIKQHIDTLRPVKKNAALAQRVLSLIDLTSLNASDTDETMIALFQKAQTVYGHVASVCIGQQFVRMAATEFAESPVKVATVANFPEGSTPLDGVLIEINRALQEGAAEIDVVFPYARYLAGEQQYAHTFVESCKAACGDQVILKVILETGALADASIIADASLTAITAGADFIKTSTGKIAEGATLEAVATMLLVIQHAAPKLKRPIGIKVSGGIRELSQAAEYLELTEQMMGKKWVTPDTFRFGSSKLVDEIIHAKF
jgi:deoxyribose-phosphate aldolase